MSRASTSHPTPPDLLAWLSGAADPALADHVAACPRCQSLVEDWRTVGLAVTQRLESEADAVFTEERLAHQHDAVMRRLRGGGARVLPFPAPAGGGRQRPRVFGTEIRRWMAAAALVGLLVGTLAGRFLLDPQGSPAADPRARAAASPGAPASPAFTGVPLSDEAFLVELDAAVFSSSPRALRALDALTPDAER